MELKEAIKILSEYRTGSYEALKDIPKVYRAIDTVLTELEKQKQIKAEMRKVAYEEGYIQGFNKCREKIMYMEVEECI